MLPHEPTTIKQEVISLSKITCIFCGIESDDEIITHLNTSHPGGLSRYIMFFGASPVVSEEVFTACDNALHGIVDPNVAALSRISDEDKRAIVTARDLARPVRSRIDTVEEF